MLNFDRLSDGTEWGVGENCERVRSRPACTSQQQADRFYFCIHFPQIP
ncbi:hypothetical protein H6G20_15700 [Desertifilum sp. FACHB-1129]|nr:MULTISPECIES: hypothetical protein [Desertifilum]MBD2313113.1 hypothetical protein [Desertifilum sp. FACHB-1129]MBD2324081.1 hypothetical protein [Desertifilum sp. FACHB-866]MBD2334016.1 hypothetical protein [Desertifilum sp. FACHB-868]MDA0212656.1 hypothetical protein [Cyanobacteria bacterium FC1]